MAALRPPGAIMVPVQTTPIARKWVAAICLAALLFAVLTPATSGTFLAFLVPVWVFFVALITVSQSIPAGTTSDPSFPFFPSLQSRPPPAA